MTPADRRIMELIDKWLISVDLHLKYADLSDVDYACAQKWPKHDRPTRWVLEIARQKVLELKSHCEARQAMGDTKFAESLELMAFLANLVGIQHIQRFIPLAEPSTTPTLSTTQTVEAPVINKPARAKSTGDETTREMPRLKPMPVTAKPAAARLELTKTKAEDRPAPASKPPPNDMKSKIVADAVRLLKWGKPWHELAELIGRIAERPPVPEIRKVLRAHKSEIESRASMTVKS